VAWHLRGFKANPLLVSSLGRDEPGREILERMGDWGMDTRGIQLHSDRPTGMVVAELEDGEPRFHIRPRQAYDAVAVEELPAPPLMEGLDFLYHGTLALREETSRHALEYLRRYLETPTLVDVNLRDPWWSRESVLPLLQEVEWVKMNEVEFSLLADVSPGSAEEWESSARAFISDRGIGNLILTFGSRGALGLNMEEAVWEEAPEVPDLVDTVGAGDAFSAVTALGVDGGWTLGLILGRAAAFAAEICARRGATAADQDLYLRHLRSWDHED
jgi:fructokinase